MSIDHLNDLVGFLLPHASKNTTDSHPAQAECYDVLEPIPMEAVDADTAQTDNKPDHVDAEHSDPQHNDHLNIDPDHLADEHLDPDSDDTEFPDDSSLTKEQTATLLAVCGWSIS